MAVRVSCQKIGYIDADKPERDDAKNYPEYGRFFIFFTVGLAVNRHHRCYLRAHLSLDSSLRGKPSDVGEQSFSQNPISPEVLTPSSDELVPRQEGKNDQDDQAPD